MMPDFNDLYFFVNVVDHGGFAPAGRALGLPKSKLSRRIAALEERLKTQLIQRTTRRFYVTEIGQQYYEHCKAMIIEAQAAQDVIDKMRAVPQGVIRLSCPIALLHLYAGEMLADFMARYPQITVHLEATNRRVDIVGEGLDIAIRVRPAPLQDSSLIMRVLAERKQCLVASPALIKQYGFPEHPDALGALPAMGNSDGEGSYHWLLYGPDDEAMTVTYQPRFVTSDMIALCEAATAGVGVVQLPAPMIAGHLATGRLIRIVPEWAPRVEIIHAVFSSRRGLLPSVRKLIDYLAQRFATIFTE